MIKSLLYLIKYFLIILFLFSSCTNEESSEDYVLKVDNLGLRKGVFERRFKMTTDYTANKEITPEILKEFIDRIYLPEYLFTKKGFDLGFDQDPAIQKNINEFKINALAASHPIKFKNLFLSDNDLEDYYNLKKEYLFSFTLIQHISYNEIESIRKSILDGNKFKVDKENMPNLYPRMIEYDKESYGTNAPVKVYKELIDMDEGQFSLPIYTAPLWVIVKLREKTSNSSIKPFGEIKKTLIKELQGIKKLEEIDDYSDSLKQKYELKINEDYITNIFDSYTLNGDDKGYFAKSKYKGSIETDFILTSNKENLSVDMFFFLFNRSNQVNNIHSLSMEDLNVFIDDLTNQFVLYLDAIDKNIVEKNETLKDQITNKLNRAIYQKYLKEEISDIVKVTDAMARDYYDKNRETWKGEFENVKTSIISELKKHMMYEKRDELIDELSNEYKCIYNEPLLQEMAVRLTKSKSN